MDVKFPAAPSFAENKEQPTALDKIAFFDNFQSLKFCKGQPLTRRDFKLLSHSVVCLSVAINKRQFEHSKSQKQQLRTNRRKPFRSMRCKFLARLCLADF